MFVTKPSGRRAPHQVKFIIAAANPSLGRHLAGKRGVFENVRFSIIFKLPRIYLTHCLSTATHIPPFDLFGQSERSRLRKPIIINGG